MGRGNRITILEPSGAKQLETYYGCHPEFDDLQMYQGMEFSDLCDVCVELFLNHHYEEDHRAFLENGIQVLHRLNG